MPITAVRGGSADDGSLALTPRYEGTLMKLPRRELTLKRRALLAEGVQRVRWRQSWRDRTASVCYGD
jgi:hypothetical protein